MVGEALLTMRTSAAVAMPSLGFYSRLIAQFDIVYSDDIPGLCDTTGTTVTLSPSRATESELTREELISILACEAVHVSLGHTTSPDYHAGGIDPVLMAWALDFRCHAYAAEAAPGLFEAYETVTIDELKAILASGEDFEGLALDDSLTDHDSAMSIYDRLKPDPDEEDEDESEPDPEGQGDPEPDPEGGQAGGDDAGDGGSEPEDGDGQPDEPDQSHGGTKAVPMMGTTKPSEDAAENAGASEKMRRAASQHEADDPEGFAAAMGDLPGSVRLAVERRGAPMADWRALLADAFMDGEDPDTETFTPLDRQTYSMPDGYRFQVLHPSYVSETAGEIVVFVDTSGSVVNALPTLATELQGLISSVRPEKTTVVYVDAAVQHVEEFEPEDDLEFNPVGGGGTAFEPAFAWLDANDVPNNHVVYITDGYGSPAFPRDYKVTWLVVNNPRCTMAWGSTIHVSNEALY